MVNDKTTPTPSPTFYFIGVTTGNSSARRMFPGWMEALGRPEVVLAGVDLKIHDHPERYRHVVARIKQDAYALGALVTTHKIDLLEAARDMFDELDLYAASTGEVSSIAKNDWRLVGRATDPVAGGLSLQAIIGENYFAGNGREMLFLGAGGAAAALSLYLINRPTDGDRPRRITMVDILPERLARLERMVTTTQTGIQFEYIQSHSPADNDALLTRLPPSSIVINATGMGKDMPGSPITNQAIFPKRGIAWELNYRGELEFLRQAQAQQSLRQLTVSDGWDYFLHGWSQVVSHVLHLEIGAELLNRLSAIAEQTR
jgi:shikimate dehydrogenase